MRHDIGPYVVSRRSEHRTRRRFMALAAICFAMTGLFGMFLVWAFACAR